MTAADHVILTRFNLPTMGFERLVRAREGWLRDRIDLFEKYCIPSVQAQTSQAFRWLIYFDPDSPGWLKQRIQNHVDDKLYTPIFRVSVNESELLADVREHAPGANSRLITSNLDNDDALAVNFVERLQNAASESGTEAMFIIHGLVKGSPHVYLRLDRSNAFCSVACDWDKPTSCWSDWHTLLGTKMPSVELRGEPGWLQVVHGLNVSNRVRGSLTGPSRYAHLFPGMLDDVRSPARAEVLADFAVSRPRRFVRDAGRVAAKSVAMRLMGKGSLDQIKIFLASSRRQTE